MTPDQELRMRMLETNHNELKDAVTAIKDSLQSLVRLEAHHTDTREAIGRAFKEIECMEARIHTIELDMPGLRELRGWCITAALGTISIVGIALLYLVIPH